MAKKYLLVLIEEQELFRSGLRAMAMPDIQLEVVGSSSNCSDGLRLVEQLRPDLVLMDLSTYGSQGIKTICQIKRSDRRVKILALTSHRSEANLRLCLKAGADGYMVKDVTENELRIAIQTVLNGKLHLSPDITDMVISGYLLNGQFGGMGSAVQTLTQCQVSAAAQVHK